MPDAVRLAVAYSSHNHKTLELNEDVQPKKAIISTLLQKSTYNDESTLRIGPPISMFLRPTVLK